MEVPCGNVVVNGCGFTLWQCGGKWLWWYLVAIWQCGGKIEIHPCSHVGHVFRAKAPYTHPGGFDVILRNLVRVADVWMDDFKQIFYRKNIMAMDIGAGNITDRINLRKNLQCKSFQWYLDNVYPEKDYLLDRDISFRT